MEDEGYPEDDFIEDVAREYVGRYGFASLELLRERAAIAEAAGDLIGSQSWRAMIEIAERLIGVGPE